MFSIKRTGQQVLFAGMKTMTVRNGRIIEAWIVRDDLDPGRHVGAVKSGAFRPVRALSKRPIVVRSLDLRRHRARRHQDG